MCSPENARRDRAGVLASMMESIKEIVADILGLEPAEIDDEFSRETADNWDSLNHLRIVTAIEQSFSISLTMDEIESATSIRRIADFVGSKVQPT